MIATEFLAPTDTLGYLRRVFEPGDWIDIKLIHESEKFTDKDGVIRAETRDHFQTLEAALEPKTPTQLVQLQDEGWHVYVTMNPFTSRRAAPPKKDVAAIRTVYVEFDENGEAGWTRSRRTWPPGGAGPAFYFGVVAGKILRRSGASLASMSALQEALNRALQQRYGSDPQSVDASRVLRLPGTRNIKARYNPTPVVEIIQEAPGERYTPEDFKVERVVPVEP